MKLIKSLMMFLVATVTLINSLPASAITFEATNSGFILTDDETSCNYQVWVGKKGKSVDDLAKIDSSENFKSAVDYVDIFNINNDQTLELIYDIGDTNAFGDYAVRVILSKEFDVKDEYFTFKYIDPTLEERALADFSQVSGAEFKNVVDKYKSDGLITSANMGILADSQIVDNIGNYFEWFRDISFKNGAKFNSFSEFVSCVECANVLLEISDNDIVGSESGLRNISNNPFAQYLSLLYNYDISDSECSNKFKKFVNMVSNYVTKINNSDTLLEVYQWSRVLSELKGATRSAAEKIMRENATILGIDEESLINDGVTLESISEKFNTDDIENLYGQTAFMMYFNELKENVKETIRSDHDKNKTNTISSSAGGKSSFSSNKANLPIDSINSGNAENNQSENDKSFCDLTTVPWAIEDIKRLHSMNIINGITDDLFEPNSNVTREQFVKIIVNAFEVTENKNVNYVLKDVSPERWSYPFIKIAYTNHIIKGVTDDEFFPENYITRQDMALVLYNAMSEKMAIGDNELTFGDTDAISQYALTAVKALKNAGIMFGDENNMFSPLKNATRAEAATIVSRALDYLGGGK